MNTNILDESNANNIPRICLDSERATIHEWLTPESSDLILLMGATHVAQIVDRKLVTRTLVLHELIPRAKALVAAFLIVNRRPHRLSGALALTIPPSPSIAQRAAAATSCAFAAAASNTTIRLRVLNRDGGAPHSPPPWECGVGTGCIISYKYY
ncbi:hypothetical protein H4582DRAFT_2051232 [Lactarius indigo]|nr:hypothetical protein H4582DRAFT_2051232 [Lactarius indigo]